MNQVTINQLNEQYGAEAVQQMYSQINEQRVQNGENRLGGAALQSRTLAAYNQGLFETMLQNMETVEQDLVQKAQNMDAETFDILPDDEFIMNEFDPRISQTLSQVSANLKAQGMNYNLYATRGGRQILIWVLNHDFSRRQIVALVSRATTGVYVPYKRYRYVASRKTLGNFASGNVNLETLTKMFQESYKNLYLG